MQSLVQLFIKAIDTQKEFQTFVIVISLTRDEVNNRLTEIENVRNNSARIMKQQCDSQKREHSKKVFS